MAQRLSTSAARVQAVLEMAGLGVEVRELAASTRTAAEAAAAVGCTVAQIAKSIVFRARRSGRPILVVVSGVNRVDERRIEPLVGEPLGKADADFVRDRTGFAIGGVPPVGHLERIEVFIDRDLLALEEIWAAAGTPNALFKLTPAELAALTRGKVARVKV